MAAYRIVVMGVSGCGKSTLGRALSKALHLQFVEGDALHPADNVARMAAGIPLTDEDRHGWLQTVAAQLADATAQQQGVVVSCSALKRRYRDQLRSGAPDLRFVLLHGDPLILSRRLGQRRGHYMPPSLLQSQLDTLEPPTDDEHAIRLDIATPPEQQLTQALQQLSSFPNP